MKNLYDLRGFVFDLDGTLIDSNGVWLELDRQLCRENGLDVTDEELERMAAMTYDDLFAFLETKGCHITLEEIENDLNRFAVYEYANNIRLKDGVREFLTEMKNNGKKLAIATASPEILYAPVLKSNGVYDLFDAFSSTFEVGRDKDYPDVFNKACEKIGLTPSECAVFEDSLRGIRTSAKAGYYTVMVYDRFNSPDFEAADGVCDEKWDGFVGK